MTVFYNHTTYPAPGSAGSSAGLRAELDAIEAGFALVESLKADRTDIADFESSIAAANAAVSALSASLAAVQDQIDTLTGSSGETSGDLNTHLADATDAHDASAISYIPTGSISSTNVQAALTELDNEKASASVVTAHLSGTAAHQAANISFTPTGGVGSTNLQAALAELDSEKASTGSVTSVSNSLSSLSSLVSSQGSTITAQGSSISSLSSQISSVSNTVTTQASQITSLSSSLSSHLSSSSAHNASAITVSASGNLSSTSVQSALVELQGDIDGINNSTTGKVSISSIETAASDAALTSDSASKLASTQWLRLLTSRASGIRIANNSGNVTSLANTTSSFTAPAPGALMIFAVGSSVGTSPSSFSVSASLGPITQGSTNIASNAFGCFLGYLSMSKGQTTTVTATYGSSDTGSKFVKVMTLFVPS